MDLSGILPDDSPHPLGSAAFALLSCGIALETGLFCLGPVPIAAFAGMAWLWRAASRCPAESTKALGVLGLLLVLRWVVTARLSSRRERFFQGGGWVVGLGTLSAATALAGGSPVFAQAALGSLTLCLGLRLWTLEPGPRGQRLLRSFLLGIAGLGLFLLDVIISFAGPAAALLTGP